MRRSSPRLHACVALALTAIAPLVPVGGAAAQVLHERVDVAAVRCSNGVCWRPGRAADGAAAILADGDVVPAPGGGPQPQAGEPIYSPSAAADPDAPIGDGAPATSGAADPLRRARVRMDRETGPEPPGARTYHEPFNPSVFPFKRMTALDAVLPDETLTIWTRHRELEPLPIVGADKREPSRDAFWGSIVVDFEAGRWVPIPSVAPDTRVLAYRTEPEIAVELARDRADNYFARARVNGRHRLTWLSDAPITYFAGELPSVPLGSEPRLDLAPLPPATAKRAQRVLARIGERLDRAAPLARVLDPLVAYFRAFEPGDPPAATGSTYLDLALGQHGSCRHRAYAFVITAIAAGIPARYVENELHVFVEVWVPRLGWRRINLGGALVEQQVSGADGKLPYQAKGGDPFPEPPQFARGTDALPPPPRGLRARHAGTRGDGRDGSGRGSGSFGSGGASGSGGGGAGMSGGVASGGGVSGGGVSGGGGFGGSGFGGGGFGEGSAGDRVDLDALDDPAASGATVATRLDVSIAQHDALRGGRVDVAGQVTSSDGNGAGLPIEIYLDGPGGALRVGSAVTGADGRWRATIEVPRDLPLGDHRVVARTPGDGTRRPSSTRSTPKH